MYTLNYSGGHIKTEAGDNVKSTQIDVHMYILADKYDLKSLKDLALNKLEADVSNWDVELIKKDYDMVTAAITTAYGASVATSRVRSVLVRKLVEVDIFASSSSAKSALLKLIDELPAFGKALVTEAAKQKHRSLGGMKLYHCPSCSIRFMVDMTTTTSRWYCPNCERSMLGSKWAVHLVNT